MLLPKSIAKILGGVEVLGKPVRSELELAEAVRHGFLPAVTDELFDGTVLSKSDMERLFMPRCMLTYRIKKGERSTREESDRVAHVARIVAMAEETFGNREKASRWLHKPKKSFAGFSPLNISGEFLFSSIIT
jgi:putative toxin-antitoxin system antitoxin component (TIGR02293 family)